MRLRTDLVKIVNLTHAINHEYFQITWHGLGKNMVHIPMNLFIKYTLQGKSIKYISFHS